MQTSKRFLLLDIHLFSNNIVNFKSNIDFTNTLFEQNVSIYKWHIFLWIFYAHIYNIQYNLSNIYKN